MTEPAVTPAPSGPSLLHIADRVLGRPLLMHPGKVEVLLHVLEGRIPLGDASLAPLTPDASRFTGQVSASRTFRVEGGVGIVSIVGSLVNRGAWIGASSGLTSYEGLAKQLTDAAADPKVKAIMLDLDSPGGEATGMFALAAKVREVAAEKPVVAVVNDMAASAAYGIASQATEIVVSPTSIVGSIGVVLTHLDRSGELAAKGIKPTLIHAGAHKVDGNPFGPLSDAVRADLQAEVGQFYDQFVGLVAQGRGAKLSAAKARATEARTFIGQEAIDRGLADRVSTFEAVLASLQSKPAGRGTTASKGVPMPTTGAGPAAVAPDGDALAAARSEGHAAGLAEGRALGAKEAAERIGAILGSDEAKANATLAAHLAFRTAFSPAEAISALTAAGRAAAPSVPTIAERAAGMAEFGGSAGPLSAREDASAAWGRAISRVSGAPAETQAAPVPAAADPNPWRRLLRR
ncbi:S49 family peptidase [Cereibacter azotoformans]|uniref:Peptidase S49 n=1 Tax=Cereibacter sphaeroides (strain ATCC 17025 / ATH 2.4.3) TaxID=349102 RepID=A4WNQ1_CERS5|nr:S49 family peptidase [Cereibacter azotoformans]ULB08429.1 S49 family peptidase [Cereibacter azotoformans]